MCDLGLQNKYSKVLNVNVDSMFLIETLTFLYFITGRYTYFIYYASKNYDTLPNNIKLVNMFYLLKMICIFNCKNRKSSTKKIRILYI